MVFHSTMVSHLIMFYGLISLQLYGIRARQLMMVFHSIIVFHLIMFYGLICLLF